MATIRPNDNAPAEEVHYVLPTESFDLAAGGTYETDDRLLLTAAQDHPWLTVEYPEVEAVSVERPSTSVPYQEDPYSEYNDDSNDPEVAAAAERAKYETTIEPLAVDSGLNQSVRETDNLSETDASRDQGVPYVTTTGRRGLA
jgi:hypothetical protein